MRCTQEEINEYIKDNDVKLIELSFCDVFGNQKIISVLPSMLSRAFCEAQAHKYIERQAMDMRAPKETGCQGDSQGLLNIKRSLTKRKGKFYV